jgi:inosine/xanthosine triphosphatase
MRITVGSKNPVKVGAVRELLPYYEFLRNPVVSGEAVSNTLNQPTSLAETIQCAINRAKAVYNNCKYSFGIEAGLMEVPNTKTGFMNVTVCAIYDGTSHHIGLSSAFECPPVVTRMIREKGIELDEAYYKAGLTQTKRIGYSEGITGDLTKGRLTRKEQIQEAVGMALIYLENYKLYEG